MPTSGQTIQQLSRDDIINAALRKLVVIGEGQTANATQLATGTQALNNIVAEFRTLGMSIWARKSYDIVLVTGQNNYVLGVGQAENIPYPIKLYTASLKQPPAYNVQIEMNALSFTDFEWLPDDSTGIPVNYKYQPKVNQGIFTVWPTPDASVLPGTLVTIQYQSPFEYFVADVDTPDFPENGTMLSFMPWLSPWQMKWASPSKRRHGWKSKLKSTLVQLCQAVRRKLAGTSSVIGQVTNKD